MESVLMYLTIPGKDDFNLIQKIGSIFDRRKIISSYSALNGFNKYSPYDICLRETGGTIESPRGTVYSTSLHEMKNSYGSEFNEVILTADAIEIETKGELVQETKTGEKIYNYGTCFLQNNELSDLSKYRYITSDSFTDTGKKYPISIDDNGEIVYGKILLNKETGKRIIALKAVDNKIIDADPSLINPDAIERKVASGVEQEDILFRNTQFMHHMGMFLAMPVLSVNRNRVLGFCQCIDQFDLFSAGMAGYMGILENHIGSQLLQIVNNLRYGFFISGDRCRA